MGEPDDMGFTPVYEMVVKGSGDLNLRDYPGTGAVVTVVSEGDEILRVGIQEDDPNVETDGYSRFLIDGVECYARSHYFTSKYTYQGTIPTIHLPDQMALTAGTRHWFVTDQIIFGMDAGLTVHYAYSGAGERVYDGTDAFAITPSEVGTATLTVTVQVIDNGVLQTVLQKTVQITVTEADASLSAVGMLIGDSRVSDGETLNTLQSKLPNLTLLGTRTTGGSAVHHEGRGGWRAKNYVHDAQVSMSSFTLTNPFYNPTTQCFDFSYYMEQNYPDTVPDFVVIHLGPNDGYSDESVEDVRTMVESVKAYGMEKGVDICVLVMTEYLSPADGYLLTQTSNTNMIARRLKQFTYFALQSDAFEGREDEQIYLLPNYVCINGWSDWTRESVETLNGTEERITDTVHLGTEGYRKTADVIASYLYFLFGNEIR